MGKTSVIYFHYTIKTSKKGTLYHSKCKEFLKLMTLCKINALQGLKNAGSGT